MTFQVFPFRVIMGDLKTVSGDSLKYGCDPFDVVLQLIF